MSRGTGESYSSQARSVQGDVFVGKGNLTIPALKKNGKTSEEDTSASADEGPPSPCSSTTLSFLSFTTEESSVTPEMSAAKPQLNAFGHPLKTKSKEFLNAAVLNPEGSNCKSSVGRIQQCDENNNAEKEDFTRNYGLIDYKDKPNEEDFVGRGQIAFPFEDSKVSSLSGIRIVAESEKTKESKSRPSSRKVVSNSCGEHSCHSGFGPAGSRGVVAAFSSENNNFSRGRRGCVPVAAGDGKRSPNDLTGASLRRTLSPPLDFIDREPTSDNVRSKSRQPDLDLMLSGAVRSSALLNTKRDFVPMAVVPREQLRAKCKSLSDLSKREQKMDRFLDRRKVIQMNVDDTECCSHTEVAPSSMMTLAMELLVSNDNKAANLFKEAKKKADGGGDEKDSILPSLWVVPKSHSPESHQKTASHLKPAVKSIIEVKGSEKEAAAAKLSEKRSDLCEAAKVVKRSKRARSSSATVTCVALSEQTVDEHALPATRHDEEAIRNEDVERDLQTLTVADLVGSPDTAYTDTESEFESGDNQTRKTSRASKAFVIDVPVVKLPVQPLGKSRRKSEEASIENVSTHKSMSAKKYSVDEYDSDIKVAEKTMQLLRETEHSSEQDIGRPSDAQTTQISPSDMCCKENKEEAKSREAPERRSSSMSNSSSLTTVSSLSLSSVSVGSVDSPSKETSKSQTSNLNQVRYSEDSSDRASEYHEAKRLTEPSVSYQKTPNKIKENVTETSTQGCDSHPERFTFVYGTRSPSGNLKYSKELATARPNIDNAVRDAVPRPPRRSKSLEVMDKIRKTRHSKQMTQNNLAEIPMHYRGDVVKSRDAKECAQGLPFTHENGSLSNLSEINRRLFEIESDGSAKHNRLQNSKHNREAYEPTEERHQSALLISSEGRYAHFAAPGRLRQLSQVDTPGRSQPAPSHEEATNLITSVESSRKPSGVCQERIPSHKSYHRSLECLPAIRTTDGFVEDLQNDGDMSTERWFRNGEISVVDGSRVSLSKKCGAQAYTKNEVQTEFCHPPAVFLSDIINTKDSTRPLNAHFRGPGEEDFVSPASAGVTFASHQDNVGKEEKKLSLTDSQKAGDNVRKATPPPPPERRIGIVKKSDLKQYFPAYESVETRKQPHDLRSGLPSYNSCAKPFCKPPAAPVPMPGNTDSFKSQPVGSIRDLCFDSTDLHPVGYQSTTSMNDQGSSSFDNTMMAKENYQLDGEQKELENVTSTSETPTKEGRLTPNRTPVPYSKNSAVTLLTGGKNVYSSCVKITLNPKKPHEDIREKRVDEEDAPVDQKLDFGRVNIVMRRGVNTSKASPSENTVRRKSFPVKKERDWNAKYVREVITPDTKVTENSEMGKPEAPLHSTVDEGDFAGVVDGPTKNVKEIRAMFKGPDYANYAKPKIVARKPAAPSLKPKTLAERQTTNSNRNSAEVAQQVIGLFKGALTIEDQDGSDIAAQKAAPVQNGEGDSNEPRISVKDKVASFNVGKSPVRDHEINNNTDEVVQTPPQKPVESTPYAEIIETQEPSVNGHGKKTAVKQEKVRADSYDESLDQFYDVLEELTAS